MSEPNVKTNRNALRVPLRLRLREYRGSLFGHTALQLGARVYTAVTTLAVFLIVGAAGSDRALASFSLSMAAYGVVSVVINAGSGLWIVRVLADGKPLPRLLIPRTATVLICALGLWAAWLVGIVTLATVPWILLAGSTGAFGELWRGVLWARLKFRADATSSVVQATIQLAGIAIVAGFGGTEAHLLMMPVALSSIVGYLVRFGLSRGLYEHSRKLMGLIVWVREIYSYAGLSVVVQAQTQGDLLLLGSIWSGPVAGVAAYGLAMRFYYSVGMPFESLGVAILPRVALQRHIEWRRVLKVAVPVGIAILAAWLLITRSGQLFGLSSAASSCLKTVGLILAISLPFRFASYILGGIVTGSGRQLNRFIAATAGLATMLTLDLLLIPSKGPTGAASALVCADVVLMWGYAWACRQSLRQPVQ